MPKLCELVRAPKTHAGPADVSGWIRTVRESKNAGFIELTDGSCFKSVQIVYEPGSLTPELAKALGTGAAIRIQGELVLTPDMPQPFEIKAAQIELLGACDEDYPLQKKRHTLEYMRTIQHLRPRANIFQATFRVRNVVAQAIHRFFDERGFLYVHTPLITPSDCEGAGEMFRVTTLKLEDLPQTEDGKIDAAQDFFGREANLTVSGQLYGEAFALAFRDIYTFGPTFRAEYSFTARHAAEFWMIEPEMAFCDLAGNMDLAEDMVKYVIRSVMERCPDELAFFNNFVDKGLLARLENVVNSDFTRISYTEAVELLKQSGAEFKYPVEWGSDLQTEHERYITEQIYGKPVFVTGYPKDIKAFYMRLNDDDRTVAAVDLLVPGVGEIIGGSQREERLDVLKRRIEEMHMDVSQYGWYLDLRRFGGVKHAGFGLGFERILMYVTGMANIRDVMPFPRTTGNMVM